MELRALYPAAVVALLAFMLFLLVRGSRTNSERPGVNSYLASPWAVWGQVFVIGWCSVTAWTWLNRGDSGWWLWALGATVSVASLGVLLVHRRRRGAPDSVDRKPGPALPLGVAGGLALLSAGLVRSFGATPGGDGFHALDVVYVALVGFSLALLVAAGFAAFRRAMARADEPT